MKEYAVGLFMLISLLLGIQYTSRLYLSSWALSFQNHQDTAHLQNPNVMLLTVNCAGLLSSLMINKRTAGYMLKMVIPGHWNYTSMEVNGVLTPGSALCQ